MKELTRPVLASERVNFKYQITISSLRLRRGGVGRGALVAYPTKR